MNLGKLNLRFDRFGEAFIDHKKEVSQQVTAIYVLRTLVEPISHQVKLRLCKTLYNKAIL